MVATRPFLASLARFGPTAFSARTRGFFVFCATVASIAAVETLSLMRFMEQQRQLKGLTAFDRHFLVQSASILALSSVVQKGIRDERLRFRECIEMLLRLPGSKNDTLIRSMRTVENKLERFASVRMYPRRYTPILRAKSSDAHNIFESPGLPSLASKVLIQQFVTGPESNGNGVHEEKEENLARWIPKRVIWEDVPECISVGLRREGFID